MAAERELANLTALTGEKPARKMGQVRWAWSQIEEALAAGHSLKSIWRTLQADGVVLHYKTLSVYVSRIRREGPAGRKHVQTRSASAAPTTAGKPFVRPGDPITSSPGSDPAANLRERLNAPIGFQFAGTGKTEDLV